ncbi:MAG: hypothetical protein H0T10_06600 [Actinobacteria bacterium]|nr:hypothetical protein [Actinomycetota bacterium]
MLLFALAGCGGGNTRESYVADATKICKATEARVKALGTPQSFTDTQLYARRAKDAVSDGVDELKKLTPPEELGEAFDLYLAALEARRAALGGIVEAADAASMKRLQEAGSGLDVANARAKSEARRAGIPGCESG